MALPTVRTRVPLPVVPPPEPVLASPVVRQLVQGSRLRVGLSRDLLRSSVRRVPPPA